MKVIVLGAGIIGVSTAWHLLERGHEVILVDRRSDAALETSFGNAGQISVSYCEMLARRVEQVLPGVCDTRSPAQSGERQPIEGFGFCGMA